jgi:hypothetical protein
VNISGSLRPGVRVERVGASATQNSEQLEDSLSRVGFLLLRSEAGNMPGNSIEMAQGVLPGIGCCQQNQDFERLDAVTGTEVAACAHRLLQGHSIFNGHLPALTLFA